jgi:hypothetical protein
MTTFAAVKQRREDQVALVEEAANPSAAARE